MENLDKLKKIQAMLDEYISECEGESEEEDTEESDNAEEEASEKEDKGMGGLLLMVKDKKKAK